MDRASQSRRGEWKSEWKRHLLLTGWIIFGGDSEERRVAERVFSFLQEVTM